MRAQQSSTFFRGWAPLSAAVVFVVAAVTNLAPAALRDGSGVKTKIAGPFGTGKLREGQFFFDPDYRIVDALLEVEYSADLDPAPRTAPFSATIVGQNNYEVIPSGTRIFFGKDPGQDPNFPNGSFTATIQVQYDGIGDPPAGPVDLFSIIFELKPGVAPNAPELIKFGYFLNESDFLTFVDPSNNGATSRVNANDPANPIINSAVAFTAAQLLPEPTALALAVPAGLLLSGRRRPRNRLALRTPLP